MPKLLPRRPATAAAAIALVLSLFSAARLLAHAVVYPKASAAGAYEKYVLRVPNEKTTSTTRIEIRFPAGLRVTSFADVAGWQLEVLTDSAGAITGAVWTGSLPPKRFVELPFVAANPKGEARLVWPVYQTYGDSERVEWTGPEGSKRPASATTIGAAASAATGGTGGGGSPSVLGIVAIALSLLALGLALRPRGGATASA